MRAGVRLGIDVGSVRVGVAACDPDGVLATPVATLARDADATPAPVAAGSAGGEAAIRRIADLVTEHAAIEVVVGLPKSLSGVDGPAAEAARAFAASVRAAVHPIPVRLVDERLTTVDAHRALYASGRRGRAHRSVVDQAAAVLILQSALDAERASGRPPGETVPGRKPRHRAARAPRQEGPHP